MALLKVNFSVITFIGNATTCLFQTNLTINYCQEYKIKTVVIINSI